MNYHQYYPVDVLNGPGTRVTLFVAGCEHQCRGCYNQSTWRLDSGYHFDERMTNQIMMDLMDTRIRRQGLSLTGGDPLHPANCKDILTLVKSVKNKLPEKDIWLWTGYQLEMLKGLQVEIIKYIDVLVDGKFEKNLYDPSLVFRGSSNQKIYYEPYQLSKNYNL